jgi:oligopeptide/dipeptide ABC transporter ATP-binding protein
MKNGRPGYRAARLYETGLHSYIRLLFASASYGPHGAGQEEAAPISGEVDAQTAELSGCPFAGRCPRREARCAGETPPLREAEHGHKVRCLLV